MTGIIIIAALLLLVGAIVSAVVACPLFRTLSMAVDSWADGVHGSDAEGSRGAA